MLGYGLLGLMPDQLFSLSLTEFYDMVNAKRKIEFVEDDREMERTAWFTSLLMSASGSYGKKGVDPKKLYERQFDDMGNLLKPDGGTGAFTRIDKEEKDNMLSELIAKFNSDKDGARVE